MTAEEEGAAFLRMLFLDKWHHILDNVCDQVLVWDKIGETSLHLQAHVCDLAVIGSSSNISQGMKKQTLYLYLTPPCFQSTAAQSSTGNE